MLYQLKKNSFIKLTAFVLVLIGIVSFNFKMIKSNHSNYNSTYLIIVEKEMKGDFVTVKENILSIKTSWLGVNSKNSKNIFSIKGDTLFTFDDNKYFKEKNYKVLDSYDAFWNKIKYGTFKTSYSQKIIIKKGDTEIEISLYLCKLKIRVEGKSVKKNVGIFINEDSENELIISRNYSATVENIDFL